MNCSYLRLLCSHADIIWRMFCTGSTYEMLIFYPTDLQESLRKIHALPLPSDWQMMKMASIAPITIFVHQVCLANALT